MPFDEVFSDERELCNRLWWDSYDYFEDEDNCTVMTFNPEQPNSSFVAIQTQLKKGHYIDCATICCYGSCLQWPCNPPPPPPPPQKKKRCDITKSWMCKINYCILFFSRACTVQPHDLTLAYFCNFSIQIVHKVVHYLSIYVLMTSLLSNMKRSDPKISHER